ncbi:MAG: tetratricopeptide repeat protein [Syntrophorhabdaceae bacterium]|nr:tetratricopeptide repeat protein [Syntrophorhabdaceae bacterium]
MKYKIFVIILFVFILLYIYLDNLNPQNVKLYVGYGKFYETSVSSFIVIAFIFGILVSAIAGLMVDLKNLIGNWRKGRHEKKLQEFKELFDKARSYALRGDKEKAVDSLNKIIRKYPEMESPYIYLANLYISTKEFENALNILNQAEMNIGKKEKILLKKAGVNKSLNNLKDAEDNLLEIIKINEANISALTLLRDIYIEKREWENAYDVQKRIKKFVKDEQEQRRFIGLKYELIFDSYNKRNEVSEEKVIKELKEIIAEDKRFVPAYLFLADIYKKIGKLNEAGRVYGRGYTKTGHIIFLLKMEDLYIERGDPGVILKIYRRIMDISPKNRLIIFLYARLCLRLEMIDETIDMLNSLIADGVDFQGLHRAMAEAYIHRGEMKKAVDEFRRAFPIEKVYIPFACDICNSKKEEWEDFCANCFSWNTINVRTDEFLKSNIKDTTDIKAIYEMSEWDREEQEEENR